VELTTLGTFLAGAEPLLAAGTRALEVDGDLLAGREWFEAAYREGERTADARVLARAVLGLGGWWLGEHRTAAAAGLLSARLRHALDQVGPTGPLAARIRLRLAAEADYRAGSYDAVLAALDESRRSPHALVRVEALRLAHHCLLGPDHGATRQALADELVGEAGRLRGRGHLLMGLLYQTVDLFLDGHPHAHRRLAELRAELDRGEHLAVGYVVSAIEVMLAIRAGRLDEAERLARDCAEQGEKAGDGDAAAWHAAQLVAIRWYQGRLPELLPAIGQMVDAPELSAVDNSFHAAHAVAAAAAGDHPTAMRAMASLLQPTLGDLPRSGSWLGAMYGFVEAAYLIGNEQAAARAYHLLLPYRDQPMMASLAVTCFGATEHALGVAALTMGDPDRAVDHLECAVHRNLTLGHWPAVLQSRLRLAEALNRRGTPEDRSAARDELNHAAAVAQRLGVEAATHPTTPRPPVGRAVCRRAGRGWRIELGNRVAQVDHSVGMLHLTVLIANPGTEIAALELAAGMNALARTARSGSEQAVLDPTAARHYRQRLAELEGVGDLREADRAERDWLVAELGANTGPGGRVRSFSDDTERARLSVGRAIRRAIAHIAQVDPAIGTHLRAAVHTGTRCSYRPL
jgi:hypothetical protein